MVLDALDWAESHGAKRIGFVVGSAWRLEIIKQVCNELENKYCRCVHVVLAATVNVDVVLVVLVLLCCCSCCSCKLLLLQIMLFLLLLS